MTVTLQIAEKQVDPEEDVYVLSVHVFLLKQMSPAQIREAVGACARQAGHSPGLIASPPGPPTDFPANNSAELSPVSVSARRCGTQYTPSALNAERERQAMTSSLKDPSDGFL